MSASIWKPGEGTILVDAETTNIEQVFTAAAAQTLFTLTDFEYTVGTGSLAVYRNGQRLVSGVDWEETSSTTFTLLITVAAGETIVANGIIGSSGANALAAAASAEEAAASAALAVATKDELLSSIGVFAIAQGAVGSGLVDDTEALQNALDLASSLGTPLILGGSEYRYKITSTLKGGSNSSIQGNGATIDMSEISSGPKTALEFAGSIGTGVAVTSGATENSYTISVSDTSTFAVGDYVQVASTDYYTYGGGGYDAAKGEIKCIRSIVANTSITFTTPLVDTYTTAPKCYPVNWVENVNVEGVNIVGNDTPATAQRGIALRYVKDFNISDNGTFAQDCYAIECASSILGHISNNRITGVHYDGVTGTIFYGICVMDGSQWVDVSGNIGNKVRHLVVTTARAAEQGFYGQPQFINIHNNISYDSMAGGGGRSFAYESHGFGRFNVWNANQAHGCYSGIRIEGGADLSVTNNLFTGYAYQGIIVGRSDANIRNILVANNVVDNYTGEVTTGVPAAFRLDGALTIENLVVDGNTFTKAATSNVANALSLQGGSVANRGVSIRNNSASAGSVESTVGAVAITSTFVGDLTGNHFYGWRTGINVTAGAKVRVEGGSIRNFAAGGTGFGLYSNADRTIFKNVHLENINTAIRLDTSSTNCLATANTMTGCTVTTPSNAGTGNTTTGNFVV